MGQVTSERYDEHAAVNPQFYAVATQMPDLIRIKVAGFWTRDTMGDFLRDVRKAVLSLSCPAGHHSVLCDVTNSVLQSQANCADFIRLLTDDRMPARSVAAVTRNPVPRMQMRRLLAGQKNAALFEDEASAIEWLASRAIGNV